MGIVKWLDAHGVTRHKQLVLHSVPNGEGEHPTQLRKAAFTPLRISLQKNFGVRVANELRPCSFQFVTNVTEVVDLAVVDNPVPGLRVVHGLVCEGRQIKNGQTAVPQANLNRVGRGIVENDRPAIVRAAVREGLRRPLQEFCGKLRFMRNDSKNSTHQEWGP